MNLTVAPAAHRTTLRELVPWVVLAEWSALLAWLAVPYDSSDWQVVSDGLSRFGPDLYRGSSRIAVGPLGVLATGVVDAAVGRRGGIVVTALVTVVCLYVGHRLRPRTDGPWRTVLLALLLSPVLVATAVMGHLDDALVLLLLLAALHRAPGVLTGLAVAVKPWAVMGLPRRPAQLVLAGAVTAVSYAVFAPGLLDAAQVLPLVQRASTWAAVGAEPPAWWRLAELVVLAAAGLAFTWWRGPIPGLLAAFTVRCLLDPGDFTYYCSTLAVLAVLMDGRRFRGLVLLVAAVCAAGVAGLAWTRTVLLVALLVVCLLPERQPRTSRSGMPEQDVAVG